jgi:FkbM family methyltransferase
LNQCTERAQQLAVMADQSYRNGQYNLAFRYAVEGYRILYSNRNESICLPSELCSRWGTTDINVYFIRNCVSSIGFSSYFDPDKYEPILRIWKQVDRNNPEPYIRLGLLQALQSEKNGNKIPKKSLALLQHAHSMMGGERTNAAIQLIQNKVTELKVPYDGTTIYVYPILNNLTTYVLLEQGDWFEQDDLDFFRKLVQPTDRVLDLGANVGVYAISAAKRMNDLGKVVAVEPSRTTCQLLRKSTSSFSNVQVIQGAVSNKNGTGTLIKIDSPEFTQLNVGGEQNDTVDVYTLDCISSMAKCDGFDIIKMDIEGHELLAIEGAKQTIGEKSPIILYEIKEDNKYHIELVDLFKNMGYASYFYIRGTSTLARYTKNMKLDDRVLNLIAFRPNCYERIREITNIVEE